MTRFKAMLACALAIVASVPLAACNSMGDVLNNPNCVSRVSIKGSYGSVTPTGTYSASAVCGANTTTKTVKGAIVATEKPPASSVPPPPEDKAVEDPKPPA